jgi:hypothetical protein
VKRTYSHVYDPRRRATVTLVMDLVAFIIILVALFALCVMVDGAVNGGIR